MLLRENLFVRPRAVIYIVSVRVCVIKILLNENLIKRRDDVYYIHTRI